MVDQKPPSLISLPWGEAKNAGRNSGLEENIQIQSVIKSFFVNHVCFMGRKFGGEFTVLLQNRSGQISWRPHATDFPQMVV